MLGWSDASVVLVVNVWPRAVLAVYFVCFLSFVSAAQEFSGYQSDGMLLEAGFLSLFLAPAGLCPGLARKQPPMRAAVLLLLWEWSRIYFESGIVKLESGDPTWRNLTAMYEYYQNGLLPTWIGWYLQHLPHWFHIASAAATLVMVRVLVWMALLPGRWRTVCFWIVTAWQMVVIATANYAFLNYLVLVLAILLLDDAYLRRCVPARWRMPLEGTQLADAVTERPCIYAPYQPRFDWNLWFASPGSWRENAIVPRTEELLENDRAVLELFGGNSWPGAPPRMVRVVLWRYWFSTAEEKRASGVWWRCQFLGHYAPTLSKLPDGHFAIVDDATVMPQP